MTFPKARLVIAACLFVGWLCFLFYLVLQSSEVVLSRPQFLVAQVYAVVQWRAGQGVGEITEVIWSADQADTRLVGQHLEVPESVDLKNGRGAVKVLVPLQKTASGKLQIVPIPAGQAKAAPDMRIYPWTPGTRAQVDAIIKSRP